jgi:hypothetical protein
MLICRYTATIVFVYKPTWTTEYNTNVNTLAFHTTDYSPKKANYLQKYFPPVSKQTLPFFSQFGGQRPASIRYNNTLYAITASCLFGRVNILFSHIFPPNPNGHLHNTTMAITGSY